MSERNDDHDLERLLSEAFDAKARSRFPDQGAPPPPMRLPDHLSPHRHSHRSPRSRRSPARWLAPVAAAAAVILVAALVIALNGGSSRRTSGIAIGPSSGITSKSAGASTASSGSASVSSSASSSVPPAVRVHVSSAVLGDGSQVGVGMPIIVLLDRRIKDARGFAKATTVTVNGHAINGGWYFERKYGDKGHPVEADYRPRTYWPGHAQVHLQLAVKGVSAGAGLVFGNDLSLRFSTTAAHVVSVDNATHKLTVLSDGRPWPSAGASFPVSLGASNTRTRRGVKVIMEKGNSICMSGPGYHECGVRYTQRLTYDGEYLHAAPWNTYNIAHGINSSNGCTNLTTDDAKKLYDFLGIGDVVTYPNANGALMALGDGYGDWNVPWPQWQTGGLYPVS